MKKFFFIFFNIIFANNLIYGFCGPEMLTDNDYRYLLVKLNGLKGFIMIFNEVINEKISKLKADLKFDKEWKLALGYKHEEISKNEDLNKIQREIDELETVKKSVSDETTKENLRKVLSFLTKTDPVRFRHEITILTKHYT